jgi:uncharacterized protein (TIGR02145 family)
MNCPNCKNPIQSSDIDCQWCGAKLNNIPASPSQINNELTNNSSGTTGANSSILGNINFQTILKNKNLKWVGIIILGLALIIIVVSNISSSSENSNRINSYDDNNYNETNKDESSSTEESTSVIDADSNTVQTVVEEPDYLNSTDVRIGDQIWKIENLNVDRFRNGDIIQEAETAEEWELANENQDPAWCYYDNDPAFGQKFGKLYNYYAVIDARGLGQEGWHVPTSEEMQTLKENLGGWEIAGSKMKSKSDWRMSNSGTNESGFNGLPGGYRSGYDNEFKNVGEAGFWWMFPEDGFNFCGWLSLNQSDEASGSIRAEGGDDGKSIRLIKD